MEGLGVAANIIAVVDLSAKVATLCLQYSKEVSSARADIERLRTQVEHMATTLQAAQRLKEGTKGQSLLTSQELVAGCTLKHFIATGAHGDHFFGFPVLKDFFPSVTAIATKSVVDGVESQYAPGLYDGLWKVHFPPSEAGTGLPAAKTEFVALPPSNEVDLDGHLIKLYDVQHGDTHANSFVYLPELGLVVAGDIVYNGDCHQWLGEAATHEKRAQWIEALSHLKQKLLAGNRLVR